MALSYHFYKPNRLISKFISPISNIFISYVHNSNSQRTEIDVLDTFTTQLLQKKSNKWEIMRIKRKLNENKYTVQKNILNTTNVEDAPVNNVNIRSYDQNQVDEITNKYLEATNFKMVELITNQFIEYKICPSPEVLLKILSFFAQNGDKNTIIKLQKHSEELNPELYELNAKFVHYLAEAFWVKGNVHESLKLFEEVYDKHIILRRRLKLMIKYLIANVISERSEAILVLVINFTENIALKHDDYFPLACVWQACFLSEWYADQCRASELLDKHKKLCHQIANRLQYVVNIALKSHQTEVVHRLFELLIKYDMKSHYTFILQSLFNYRYWQNDLRSCAEIIQWSLNIDVPLSTIQHEQFISLLLKNNMKNKNMSTKPKPPQNYQYKF